MTQRPEDNADQQEFWDKNAGPIWAKRADDMDALLAPAQQAMLDLAALQQGEHVIDIGCGAGDSSFAAARIVGAQGQVAGVDISQSLLALARKRADEHEFAHVQFTQADAQVYSGPEARADVLISRFGSMFFADPQAAFANMVTWLKPGGRISFATWGQIDQNPFFTLPAQVCRGFFGPGMPRSQPDLPGPFSLRDLDAFEALCCRAGLTNVTVAALPVTLIHRGARADYVDLISDIGPVPGALRHFDPTPEQRAGLQDALLDALVPFENGDVLEIPALINIATGNAS